MATGKGFVRSAVLVVVLALSSRGHAQGFHLPLEGPLQAPLPEDFLTIDPYAVGDIKHDHDIIILEDANDPKSFAHGPLPPSFGLLPSLPPSFGKPSLRPSFSKRPPLPPPVGKHPALPPPVGLPPSLGKPHSFRKPPTHPPSFGKPHSFGKPSTLPPNFGKRPFTGKPSVRPPSFGLPPSFGRPSNLPPSFSKLPTLPLSHPATLPPVVNTPVPAHAHPNSVADTAASSFYPQYPPFTQHDLGYDPFVYAHPTPDEGAYFPTHGFNVLKNLDSHHLEDDDIKLFFPSNGYNLDPYFKDFPIFGYFQYAPEFDTSHEFDTTQKFDTAPVFDKIPEIDIAHDFDTAPRRRRMTPHRDGRVLKASSPLLQGIRDLPLSSETGPHMPSLPKQGIHE
ncbi:extensin-like [Penaeus chinensis]|uniref:extensin-like n=1 Tax=Penaeus chinensis TaxID=139456 RepID=UPI001FB848E1|nr:extensin-like [Penaeus chinensis]